MAYTHFIRGKTAHIKSLAVLSLVMLTTMRCDIPTEAPSFAVSPTVRVPLLFSEGFVLIGPNAEGVDGLIDTTSADFDSLFMVDPSDRSVFISQEISGFDLSGIDGLLDPIDISDATFETTLRQFESQDFSSEFSEQVGGQSSDAIVGTPVPADMTGGLVYFPVATASILSLPESDLLDLSDATVTEFEITNESGGLNQITFRLTNNQAETLTDGSFVAGSTPDVIIESPEGAEIARSSFASGPASGQTAAATFDLQGMTLPAGSRYRFDVGTESGMNPILNDPNSIGIALEISEIHYDAFTLSNLKQQDDVDISQPSIAIASDYDFYGATTRSGQIRLTVYNDLPVPITIDQLDLQNVESIDSYPAGHFVAQTSGQSVSAQSSAVIVIPFAANGFARTLESIVLASSPGSGSPVRMTATDGLRVSVDVETEIDQILIRPAGESVTEGASIAFDMPDITMPDATDYVELSSGQLSIDQLTNELDFGLSSVQISFPGIRSGNFSAADSLVLTIPGGMPRGSSRANVAAVDLTDMRIYATGEQLTYNIRAIAENAADVRTISVSDRILGSISANGLAAREIEANIAPLDVALGTDANDDGSLDLLDDNEAHVTTIGLDQLSSVGISDLTLAGAELTLDIQTDIATDFVLIGAIVGIAADGSMTYLSGLNERAVSKAEADDSRLVASGARIGETSMIRLDVAGSATIGKVVERTLKLDESNSSIAAFVSSLPENIRFIGEAIVQPDGGKAKLREDFLLTTSMNVSVPIAIGDSFSFDKEVNANLSGLDDLSDPTTDFQVNSAELVLDFVNAMPIGVDVRLNFADENGNPLLILPAIGSPAFAIEAGDTDNSGFTTQSSEGSTSFEVSADDLRTIAQSATLHLDIGGHPGNSGIGRFRSDDKIQLSLSGNFDITVNVGK